MPEMVNLLQHDAKKNWRQFQTVFFQFGPVGVFSTCQKKIFQSENSNRSKQTTAKCKQRGKN